jgi:predicted nuclease of restriction endonuclease-like RecB superfamily
MRFALADLKKSILRRGGEPRIVPYLLRRGELVGEIADLTALYESWLGHERGRFPTDRPSELIGDYRVARCLEMCLGEWYVWQSPPWPGPAGEALAASLAARGITSAGHLRLALYDAVNARGGGYLGAEEREPLLAAFAADLGIPLPILDLLLALDTDAEAVLRRVAPVAPSPADLAARYNQRAVEALLANASAVEWIVPPDWGARGGEGLGTVVKRICFLARRLGVSYDLAFADEESAALDERDPALAPVAERNAPHDAGIPTLDSCGRPLVIMLYGPQEVTGAPNQYGERLARLCRALLGYRRAKEAGGRGALEGEALRGTARVYLHGRPLLFSLDDRLVRLLRQPDEKANEEDARALSAGDDHVAAFDSSLEARLHTEFAALEAIGETHGWHLEREPAPLLAAEMILVPDFALTRGARRIYLEIAGYWRPGYRERKARKLAALRGRVDIVVAAPDSARAEFANLGTACTLLWYDEAVSARAILDVLGRAFNDFDTRLADLDRPGIRAELAKRGCLPAREAQVMLRCYTRGELASAVAALAEDAEDGAPPAHTLAIEWLEGIGLCTAAWVAAKRELMRAIVMLTPEGTLSLPELRARVVEMEPSLADLPEAAMETLALRAGLYVQRESIFEAMVSLAAGQAAAPPSTNPAAQSGRRAQPRSGARRKHSRVHYVTQPLLVPEGSAD